jgi:hypothetical protein
VSPAAKLLRSGSPFGKNERAATGTRDRSASPKGSLGLLKAGGVQKSIELPKSRFGGGMSMVNGGGSDTEDELKHAGIQPGLAGSLTSSWRNRDGGAARLLSSPSGYEADGERDARTSSGTGTTRAE